MSIVLFSPDFSQNESELIAKDLFGITGSARLLPSERDQNFLITAGSRDKYVLKIANLKEDINYIKAETEVIDFLFNKTALTPKVIPNTKGELISTYTHNGNNYIIRMITFINGQVLGKVKRHSNELLFDLGKSIGTIDIHLCGYKNDTFKRDFLWDISNGLNVIKEYNSLVTDPILKETVLKIAESYRENVLPLEGSLNKSIIYNDANDYNILLTPDKNIYVNYQKVAGIIDFGDMVYSYTIVDLAVTTAYVVINEKNPLLCASEILKGYHSVNPLSETEIRALYDLICMRLAMSVCIAAYQQSIKPDNEYLNVSQQPIRNTLPEFASLNHSFVTETFRHALGMEPSEHISDVNKFLKTCNNFGSVVKNNFNAGNSLVLDLSIGSPLLSGDINENNEPELTRRLFSLLKRNGLTYGIGRYDEPRYIYTSELFNKSKEFGKSRTVHLGVDIFAEIGTDIFSPLDGTIFALNYNNQYLDYGHLAILEHETDKKDKFYTLYGHLGKQFSGKLSVGQSIKKGDKIAEIGAPSENGGWAPHLHFQIIIDPLGLGVDFPGVACPLDKDIWEIFSPDPNLILRIDNSLFPVDELTKDSTLEKRKSLIGRNLSIAYNNPVKVVRGWKQYLFDEMGNKYIDSYNNVAHVGHCHPHVVNAIQNQITVLNTNTRYLHDNIIKYAEKLTSYFDKSLNVCYFVNSASEANELAIRMMRYYTNAKDMIVLDAAYHGHTNTLIDISPYKHDGPGGKGKPDWVHKAPIADDYRGKFKRNDPDAGKKYAENVNDVIKNIQSKNKNLAGFICEVVPSVGGQIFFPDDYLGRVYDYVRKAGGLCIADEVQTGFGRIGSHMWAFEKFNVIPDIVILGKPIGNGHPLGAVITTENIANTFNNGMEFFSTFGGNPVSCAAGMAVLEVLEKENLMNNALVVGNYMLERLKPLVDKYKIIGDVRGSGLFLGVELVKDKTTLEPAAEEASFISNRMREYGILLGTDGPYHNVIKIRPPMPINPEDAKYLVDTFIKILDEDFERETSNDKRKKH
jgi:4-aminobutyrate aminotransferase-like enzyme/Ser/Thr protein kinase RdoA (MazF antagonist)